MLTLLLLALQDPAPDVSQLELHALVGLLRRHGDHEWELSAQKERPLPVLAEDELRERLRLGAVLDLGDWQTILLEKGYLQHRERWPKGEPFAIGLHVPWCCTGITLELAPHTAGWSKVRASASDGLGSCMGGSPGGYEVLGALFWTDREAVFDLRVTRGLPLTHPPPPGPRSRTDLLGSIRIPVQAVPTLEQAVPRVSDPELEAEIRRLLRRGLSAVDAHATELPCDAQVRLRLAAHPPGVLLSLRCRALESGREVVSFQTSLGTRDTSRVLLDLPAHAVHSKENARDWTLALQGDNRFVLREWDATSYWAGELEIPLRDLIRH